MPSRKTTASKAAPSDLTLNHAMIYARDVAAASKFYIEALGMKPLQMMLPYYARLRSPKGASTIALHQLERGAEAGSPGVRLYWETPDLPGAVRRVKAAGYAVKSGPKKMPWGWTHAYLDDPDGHEISLYWSAGLRTKRA